MMHSNETIPMEALLKKAVAGDKNALETVLLSVRDLVFNLSLRMLGSIPDAEDATQDILLKIMTGLAAFRQESSLTTWVFRIAVNHLITYKKHLFATRPLNFEFYGNDIAHAAIEDVPDLAQGVERSILAEELKLSCTNVMLQCLDTESRCIFILGTMFKLDSRIAGELFNITAETYRQRLSRTRRKMADFLSAYCGAYGQGKCQCKERVNYAIQNHRLNPAVLEYTALSPLSTDKILEFKSAMEEIDDYSKDFSFCKAYKSPERTKKFFTELLDSDSWSTVTNT